MFAMESKIGMISFFDYEKGASGLKLYGAFCIQIK